MPRYAGFVQSAKGNRIVWLVKKTKEAIQQEVRREVERLMQVILKGWEKTGSMDLEATEMAVREAMHSAGAAILTVLLEEEPPEAKTIDCTCGRTAEYLELRPKSVLTAVGWAQTVRAYYLCRECHTGQAPMDKELDVEKTEFSPGVRRMMALTGYDSPFDSGRKDMKVLAGLTVTAKAVERVGESIGTDIARWRESQMHEIMDGRNAGGSKTARQSR
ncbi:MAG: hypothetical protein ACREDR_04560 [Blastocatellia bacterium]